MSLLPTKGQAEQTVSRTGSRRNLFLSYAGLPVVLVIFILLTTLYSLIVPITQGEDELAHYRYIRFIAQEGRLPVNYAEREQAWYRSDWPPLYHLVVGLAVSGIDTTQPRLKDVGESPHRRLVGQIFYPRLIIYTEDVNWPWQDGILAWHLGRFISILFAAGALIFTYLTALALFEMVRNGHEQRYKDLPGTYVFLLPSLSSKGFALVVTAFLAFIPRFLFTSAMLGDDSLFILLSAIFIWLLLRVLSGSDSWWLFALLGLVLGLSITTKYSTGLLPLAVIPVVVWRAGEAGWRWSRAVSRILLSWLFTVIGAGWWFGWIGYHFNTIQEDGLLFGLLRPLLASGPDVSMRRIFSLFSGTQFTGLERPDAIEAGTFWEWLTYLFQTFWGVPVLEQDPLFPWVYLVMLLFCLATFIGLWRFWQAADALTRTTLGVLIFIVVLLLPFPILRFFLTRNILETGQGRHILYPAAQAIPILLMLGWFQFSGSFDQRIKNESRMSSHLLTSRQALRSAHFSLRSLLSFPILFLLAWSLFLLIYMAAVYPDPLPVRTTTFDPQTIPRLLEHRFGDKIQLLGYGLESEPEQARLNLTLYWRSRGPVEENYRIRIQLVDSQGRPHFVWLSHPLNGRYPTRAWDKGDVIRDRLPLPLAGVPPGAYTLQLDLLHEAQNSSLTGNPVPLEQVDLEARPPVPNPATIAGIDYRLWVEDGPARYRQSLPLSWLAPNREQVAWFLVGPDGVARPPDVTSRATAIFIVGADWPSGEYRLRLNNGGSETHRTDPLLTVANDLRLFEMPSLPEAFVPVEATFANSQGEPQVKLLGYSLPTRRVEPGGGLPLTLYWQSLAPVLGDYIVFDVLLDENQQVYGGYDRLPREYYSTILWAAGEVVIDGFVVPVSPEAPPGVYNLHVGLYSLASGSPISLPLLENEQLTGVTNVDLGPVKVGGPPPEITVTRPTPQVELNQPFGDQITLLGYDLTDGSGQQSLTLTLYWRAERSPNTNYTTFLHLRNETGRNVAQKDRPPATGQYPTSLWDAGEIIVDEITLPLADLPPGTYTPVVGLYDFTTGTRLPTAGVSANEIRLESVTIP